MEFCHDGQWGTVCDDGWDGNDARLVCRQLGYPETGKCNNIIYYIISNLIILTLSGSYALQRAPYGQGTGPIWLDNVRCNANIHNRLTDCPANPIGVHNCQHSEDAGVICLSKLGNFVYKEQRQMSFCYIFLLSFAHLGEGGHPAGVYIMWIKINVL